MSAIDPTWAGSVHYAVGQVFSNTEMNNIRVSLSVLK